LLLRSRLNGPVTVIESRDNATIAINGNATLKP
jgi:hypothetical protein